MVGGCWRYALAGQPLKPVWSERCEVGFQLNVVDDRQLMTGRNMFTAPFDDVGA
jgi:hypothetical protein